MDDFRDASYFGNESATFGDRVAAAREAAGLNQKDLARRLGVKAKTVQCWEDDLSEPRANKLQMMAGLLNVSVMWLLNGEGDGLVEPSVSNELPGNVAEILLEIRTTKADFARLNDKLGTLEKRLSTVLRNSA